MNFHNVCLESFGYALPAETVTSDQLEARLAPLYERLRLPAGRLELMTGIRERRFWSPETMPSEISIQSGRNAIEAAGIDVGEIGALVHGSVCRDHLEPATACRVHHELGLRQDCVIYDVSNACLGVLSGALQIASMIELGQIRAGLVVGTENGRQLVDNTVRTLNEDKSLTRNQIKLAVASLTIGSASCAMLLCDRELSQTQNLLHAAAVRAHTQHNQLCHSIAGSDETGVGSPLMQTDSERLMVEGIEVGGATFDDFLRKSGWSGEEIQRTFSHQVGLTHRKLVLERLGLSVDNDFATVQWLGNTGSAALPVTMAIGAQTGRIKQGENVAMLGIGSGINCVMMGVDWQEARVCGTGELPAEVLHPVQGQDNEDSDATTCSSSAQ
ncbi:3-oxoacyl-ACP synthase III [Blastopirellula retiformator]|uniref:3-oxoacyl-[acyl-carrier-protein] synthase 3 n=1 Tax=Blastopirellula retiformator TaxID=2527970 RepID=A0A5C5UTF7_9BACT|nr:3-oxoacyl-ACP synthase III [Blastopirellula retiformator]TWT29671.1 3-oxoacyl-[acyl-carrier-protein] synthase 3 [Blastopirellula retiformator]